VDLQGYSTFAASQDESAKLLLDAKSPELTTTVPALIAALGQPGAKRDFKWGYSELKNGEWVWPDKEIALFVNVEADFLPVHIALLRPPAWMSTITS